MKEQKEINLEYLKEKIHRISPKLKENDTAFSTALILLALLVVGTNKKKLSNFTKLPFNFVESRMANFRKGGVVSGHKIGAGKWFEKDGGSMGFCLDVCIGEGLVERKSAEV